MWKNSSQLFEIETPSAFIYDRARKHNLQVGTNSLYNNAMNK